VRHGTGQIERQVTKLASREPDDAQNAAGAQQIADTGQSTAGINVMQAGHCRDEVEGRRLERMRQEVAQHKCDTSLIVVLSLGLVDAHLIKIDAYHFRHVLAEFAYEHAFAAADIQSPPGTVGNGVDDQSVIVDVVVPPGAVSVHQAIMTRLHKPGSQRPS
jgi:hypothetical protein